MQREHLARRLLSGALSLTLPILTITMNAGPSSASVPRAASAPTATPSAPVVGQATRIRGLAPGPAHRTVHLQVRRPDGSWRRLATGTTGAYRHYDLRVTPTTVTTVRVVAPPTRRPTRARWRSGPRVIRPVAQTAEVVVPVEAHTGEPVVVSGVLTPARPGTAVTLQVLEGTTWRAVGTHVEDARGVAQFPVEAPAPGSTSYRVLAAVAAGAPRVVSAPSMLRTRTAPTGVPRIDITTDDGTPVESDEVYEHASIAIEPNGSGVPAYTGGTRLRIRGNFTSWFKPKLPYKVKLDQKADLGGLPASKDWVLLANAYDRSLQRTALGFEVSRRLGLPWSARMVDAEVYLNGALQGLYQLGEGIEVDPERLDIALADDDPVDGGYLLEADAYDDTDPRFTTAHGLQVYVKRPSDVDDAYVAGVQAQVQKVEDVLYGPDFKDPTTGYRSVMDVSSFVDWYLVNELLKNCDASLKNSIYLYRPAGGLLTLGPAWDFDISAGNRTDWDLDDPTGWFVRQNWYGLDPEVPSQITGPEGHWLVRMFEDPAFVADVRRRWLEVRGSLRTLPAWLDAHRQLISPAATLNFTPRADGGAGQPLGRTLLEPEGEFVFHGSWAAETTALSSWLVTRMTWMDQQLL